MGGEDPLATTIGKARASCRVLPVSIDVVPEKTKLEQTIGILPRNLSREKMAFSRWARLVRMKGVRPPSSGSGRPFRKVNYMSHKDANLAVLRRRLQKERSRRQSSREEEDVAAQVMARLEELRLNHRGAPATVTAFRNAVWLIFTASKPIAL